MSEFVVVVEIKMRESVVVKAIDQGEAMLYGKRIILANNGFEWGEKSAEVVKVVEL